jgi:hypothetical protein
VEEDPVGPSPDTAGTAARGAREILLGAVPRYGARRAHVGISTGLPRGARARQRVTPPQYRARQEVGVEYLIVNSEGKILAVLQRGAEVARELARIERDSPTERVTVVRHEEDIGGLASTESFVTVRQLS